MAGIFRGSAGRRRPSTTEVASSSRSARRAACWGLPDPVIYSTRGQSTKAGKMTFAKLLTGVFALALVAAAGAGAAGRTSRAPQAYYLALGDSIAYGAQPTKMNAGLPPSGFH